MHSTEILDGWSCAPRRVSDCHLAPVEQRSHVEKSKRRKGHVTNAGDIMAFKILLVASLGSEANNFSESLASNSFMNSWINKSVYQIKPRAAWFPKTVVFLRLARNSENVTLAGRQKEHFRGLWAFFFVAKLPQKKICFNTQEFTRFLSAGVVTASSHALWRVPKLGNRYCHCQVDTPHMHNSEYDFLFFKAVCSPRSRSRRVTRIMSTEALLSTISVRIRTTRVIRRSRVRFFAFVPRGACASGSRRTKSLEIVATRVVTGTSH